MKDFEKLLESGLLDEETSKALTDALDTKVQEKIEESKESLREEFVQRYEYDKKVMVEAADKMFNEGLEAELKELRAEKSKLIESKVKYKRMIKENAKAIQKFAAEQLKAEIVELRKDRKGLAEGLVAFENFAVKKLTAELSEFHADKRDLVETKVRLIKEAKAQIDVTKREFVRRASNIVESKVKSTMTKEIKDFRKDIKESRKNYFGRRIFEAFQAEFMASHSSDGTMLKDMDNAIKERDNKIAESATQIDELTVLSNAADAKTKLAESKLVRHKKLGELLGPLPRSKKELMGELLDKTPTRKLDEAYKKHIQYVLGDSKGGKVLAERKEEKSVRRSSKTGNKRIIESTENDTMMALDTARMKKLAGL